MLIRDYEILNSCISFDSQDKMSVKFNPKHYIQQGETNRGSSSSSMGHSGSDGEQELGISPKTIDEDNSSNLQGNESTLKG